ncbi:MAG: ATP-binding cassette domain-containing protein, partial [Anaerolineales bacterium]
MRWARPSPTRSTGPARWGPSPSAGKKALPVPPDRRPGAALIQIRNLTVRYPRTAAPALRDLSFEIDSGQLVLLLGPSGSGKSTLARTLAGLIPHSLYA